MDLLDLDLSGASVGYLVYHLALCTIRIFFVGLYSESIFESSLGWAYRAFICVL